MMMFDFLCLTETCIVEQHFCVRSLIDVAHQSPSLVCHWVALSSSAGVIPRILHLFVVS